MGQISLLFEYFKFLSSFKEWFTSSYGKNDITKSLENLSNMINAYEQFENNFQQNFVKFAKFDITANKNKYSQLFKTSQQLNIQTNDNISNNNNNNKYEFLCHHIYKIIILIPTMNDLIHQLFSDIHEIVQNIKSLNIKEMDFFGQYISTYYDVIRQIYVIFNIFPTLSEQSNMNLIKLNIIDTINENKQILLKEDKKEDIKEEEEEVFPEEEKTNDNIHINELEIANIHKKKEEKSIDSIIINRKLLYSTIFDLTKQKKLQ